MLRKVWDLRIGYGNGKNNSEGYWEACVDRREGSNRSVCDLSGKQRHGFVSGILNTK